MTTSENKNKHLTLDNRIEIQECLAKGMTFKAIAARIGKDNYEELTAMHREVLDNLGSIQGALRRMNRSIQAKGTFGIMKHDRSYKRIVRRGINSVRLEVFLVSIGHNLYKYYNKNIRVQVTA